MIKPTLIGVNMNYMKFDSIKLTTSIPMEPPKSSCFFPGCSTVGFLVGK